MMQQDNHIFQGMRRDNHPIRQEKQFLWDARNIRLTTRDGNTSLSITNEKSTKEKFRFNPGEHYIGHATIGEYLIVFTTHLTEGDRIYRFTESNKELDYTILYKGNLGFRDEFPLQTLADYESEFIQKVYWVDGNNSPRVINIAKPELLKAEVSNDYSSLYTDSPFDFVQNLELYEDVKVERLQNGSGIFPSGVIQYAFTYYHKYGQESNIFNTTELLNIAHNDRGGSPEDNISTAFNIHIENIQNNFQYLRIYSIIRTSIDATPTVKRVVDIELSGSSTIDFIDDGTTGDTVDPAILLYIGGKDIVAGCIASKDNTLFLGDITYRRREASTIERLPDLVKGLPVFTSTRTVNLFNYSAGNSVYKYNNQLIQNTSTFKVGETYRLGLQFQYINGEWSEPLFIKDLDMSGVKPFITSKGVTLPIFKASINTIKSLGLDNKYVRVRPLVVLPTTKDKTILAQGILCPTVFNVGGRESNAPFSQASWFLRPFSSSEPITSNDGNAGLGAIAEFRHYRPLLTGFNRGAEVQNMFLDTEATSQSEDTLVTSLTRASKKLEEGDSSYKVMYYVDQSILTFHSPDIEFNDAIKLTINNNTGAELHLVGVAPFSANCGDIDVQMSSVQIDPEASGFVHRSIINTTDGGRSLVSGLFFEDAYVDDENASYFAKSDNPRPWMTYLWHRSGSLNNDCVRPEGTGTKTAVLKKKVISNMKFSKDIKWLKEPINIPSSEMQLFDSNEISLLKIKDSYNKNGDITYYGNVDSMNPSYSKFRLVTGSTGSKQLANGPTPFAGYIEVSDGVKLLEIRFNNLIVDPKSGNKVTGSMNGIVTSDTVVRVPIPVIDETTGEEKIEYQNINLKDANFSIVINNNIPGDNKPYSGSITKDGNSYSIKGNTSFVIQYKSLALSDKYFDFNSGLRSVDPSNNYIGDYQGALKLPKDAVRIKYKSTPHVLLATQYENGARKPLPVIAGTSKQHVSGEGLFWQNNKIEDLPVYQDIPVERFNGLTGCPSAYLWIAEIRQTNIINRFGGDSPEALRNNLWIPAGPSIRLDSEEEIEWRWGDTWYQRYDCLKTYPFTHEDENQVVEIGSFMCETRVNIDGRYDRNRGAISNLNMSPTNFNLINPVYSQKNTFFNYRILDSDFYKSDTYSSQLMWTLVKSPSAVQDTWTNIHTASSLDLDGVNGKLTSIHVFNDLLLGFQERSIQHILFNSRIQIPTSDNVPIEIASSQKVEGTRTISNKIGCQDKFSTVSTPLGIYFIDNENHSIYLFNGELHNLSMKLGSMYWVRDNYSDMTWRFYPWDFGNNGISLYYDPKYQDVYFTPGNNRLESPRDALCYSEQLDQFTSFFSYGGAVMFPYKSKFYSIAFPKNSDTVVLWENFADSDSYNEIFGTIRDYSFSFISNDNPTITKIFDTIGMRADCYIPNKNRDNNFGLIDDNSDSSIIKQVGKPFNYIRVDNEYQDTGEVTLDDRNMRKKFRVWRALIPRNKGSRERIRNPWAKITIGMRKPDTKMTILHDINVGYTV